MLRVLGLQHRDADRQRAGGLDSNEVVLGRFQKTNCCPSSPILYAGANIELHADAARRQLRQQFERRLQLDRLLADQHRRRLRARRACSASRSSTPTTRRRTTTRRPTSAASRLGIFLHTIADAGMGPPSSSAFRLTFGPVGPSTRRHADRQRRRRTTPACRVRSPTRAPTDIRRRSPTSRASPRSCSARMWPLDGPRAERRHAHSASTATTPPTSPAPPTATSATRALFPSGSTNVMSPSLSYERRSTPHGLQQPQPGLPARAGLLRQLTCASPPSFLFAAVRRPAAGPGPSSRPRRRRCRRRRSRGQQDQARRRPRRCTASRS
jgi:hypothetical protein